MRPLLPAPGAVLDPATGRPRFGSYVGAVPRVDLAAIAGGRVRRALREKRWIYVAVASDEVFAAVAIARFGYAATCFGYVFDARAKKMLATSSVLAPPAACRVGEGTSDRAIAAFRFGGVRGTVERASDASSYFVDVDLGAFRLRAGLDAADAPPAMTAIAPVGSGRDGLVTTTEKRALLAVRGEVEVAGRRFSLNDALAGYDYTHGLLARRTVWRWAFALGRAKTGQKVALNLVQGFVGEPECTAWVGGEVFPLCEGRFAFDPGDPLSEWHVTTADGAVDLRFTPGGLHSEEKDLGLVASRFVQPAGSYRGTLRVGGRTLDLDGILGVTEDQEVLW